MLSFINVTNTNHESTLVPKNYVRNLNLSFSFSLIISSLNGNFKDVLIKEPFFLLPEFHVQQYKTYYAPIFWATNKNQYSTTQQKVHQPGCHTPVREALKGHDAPLKTSAALMSVKTFYEHVTREYKQVLRIWNLYLHFHSHFILLLILECLGVL